MPDRAFFGHPRGLSTLFFTEMWERFSYYGMRALLILFMTAPVATGGLALDTATAGAIYGIYTAMVYLMSLPGGWIADRLLGQRRAVLYGGILIARGHFSWPCPRSPTFYLGLVLIVLGTGLLKPNISVIVGQLYARRTTRAATPGSRSSTWASTWGRSSRRWSAATSARRVELALRLRRRRRRHDARPGPVRPRARVLGDAGLRPVPAASPAAQAT